MDWALENLYFKWLCAKVMFVLGPPTPSLTYWKLLRILHSTEFVWLISGDDNRAADGLELRDEYLLTHRNTRRHNTESYPCSVLELLIALSRRAEFQTDDKAERWFWRFMENLGLIDFTDAVDVDPADVDEILERFIWRTYSHDGEGGLFPIRHSCSDQRTTEIWYQLHEYLVDQDRLT